MTTLEAMAHTVRVTHLRGGQGESRNTISASVSDTTGTTISLTHAFKGIAPGSRVSCELEDWHTYQSDSTAKTLTVERGAYGSTAATHTTVGTVVLLGAKHSNFEILTTANKVLKELQGKGLYKTAPVELTYAAATDGYNLAGLTDFLRVIEVYVNLPGAAARWSRIDITEWEVIQGAETDDFASGLALMLVNGARTASGQPIRVTCAVEFPELTALSDNVETVTGLATADILELGVAVSLASNTPMERNDLTRQPDPRRAAEVPPGAWLSAPNRLARRFEDRVEQELSILEKRHPVRLRTGM